jgi:dTDP-4-amino-4,6-dideoxygalactose transaminase
MNSFTQQTPSATSSLRKIPFFNYPQLFLSDKERLQQVFEDVGTRGAYILQSDLKTFEDNLAKFCGVKYALGVADGTMAISLILMAAGLKQGDEVLFCSHTFIATASAIHFAGGTPVPVECGPDHMMDPGDIEHRITPKTRFILPTQLNGRCCDMEKIQAIATKHNLQIVEDSAQALGSYFKGQHAGTFGIGGTFSFYPAKTLGCFGDGGAVVTNDETLYKTMLALRDHGRGENGDIEMWGLNSRLDNLQAAFLNHKLQSFKEVVQRRREIASLYHAELSSIPQLHLPIAPDAQPNHYDAYQNYEIEAENRDQLKAYLAENGVGTLIQWGGKAVHQFKALGFKESLPFTEKMTSRGLLLPIHPFLSNEDVTYVCSVIKAFYEI